MGWRDALERQLWAECAGKRVEVYSALTAMPAPDRIAMARELLAGTGRVVARDVGRSVYKSSTEYDDGNRNGWNACRAAMLGDGDA